MRLPLVQQLSNRGESLDQDAVYVNCLMEQDERGPASLVRPGIAKKLSVAGGGKGMVGFNGDLLSVYGNNLFELGPNELVVNLPDPVGTAERSNGVAISRGGAALLTTGEAADTTLLWAAVWVGEETIAVLIPFEIYMQFTGISGETSDTVVVCGCYPQMPNPDRLSFFWTLALGYVDVGRVWYDTTPVGVWLNGTNDLARLAVNDVRTIIPPVGDPYLENIAWWQEWTPSSVVQGPLIIDPLGEYNSYAVTLSADGLFAAGYKVKLSDPTDREGFLWSSAAGAAANVYFSLAGSADLKVTGMSSDGKIIVGVVRQVATDNQRKIFKWTQPDGLKVLDVTVPGYYEIDFEAAHCSLDGTRIVGFAIVAQMETPANPWAYQLHSFLIAPEGNSPIPGNPSMTVKSITDDGQYFIGEMQAAPTADRFSTLWALDSRRHASTLSGDFFDFTQSTL